MGTQLAERGLDMGGQNNLVHPEHVLDIHKAYAGSGCHLLITNTLTMNRTYIETHNLNIDVRDVNSAGARLAKEAAGSQGYVMGDIGSTGKLLEPYGDFPESKAFETFREQAAVLAEGGVDGFIIETMIDLREALCALRACREAAPLPVIVSMAFSSTQKDGVTIMGNTAAECAQSLSASGAHAIGTNCGDVDPFQMADIVACLSKAIDLPILAQPNAGMPKLVNGSTTFDMAPDVFSEGLMACIRSGASWVGGCCGTSPAHIRAVAEAINDRSGTA